MPILRTQANKMLKAWYPVFWNSVIYAFSRYYEIHVNELGAIHERTKSSYINDIIVDNLKQSLFDTPNVEWESKYGQRRLWIEGLLCVRIKKLNRDLLPKNYYSQASFDFYSHSIEQPVQLRFPDMPAPTCLFLGYSVNKTKTAPEALFVICPKSIDQKGKIEIEWVLPIPKPEGIAVIIGPTVAQEEEKLPSRVIVKSTAKKISTSQ